MNDIGNIHDIQLFVDDFYTKVRLDDLLGPIFSQVIKDDWQPHLNKMYAFWNAVLFGESGYKGNPFSKHAPLKIWQDHFNRWLLLFRETIDKHFEGPVADDTKKRAGLMAEVFIYRLQNMTGGPDKVVV